MGHCMSRILLTPLVIFLKESEIVINVMRIH